MNIKQMKKDKERNKQEKIDNKSFTECRILGKKLIVSERL